MVLIAYYGKYKVRNKALKSRFFMNGTNIHLSLTRERTLVSASKGKWTFHLSVIFFYQLCIFLYCSQWYCICTKPQKILRYKFPRTYVKILHQIQIVASFFMDQCTSLATTNKSLLSYTGIIKGIQKKFSHNFCWPRHLVMRVQRKS